MYQEEKEDLGDYEIDDCGSRFVFWCISEHGPFRAYLFKMKLSDNEWCRYCGAYPETAIHLANECEAIDLTVSESYEESKSALERKSNALIKKLKTDDLYV